jgi:NAD+ kinase
MASGAKPRPAARIASAPDQAPRAVRRVLVVADHDKDGVLDFEEQLLPWLTERGLTVDLEGDVPALVRRRDALAADQAGRDLPDLVIVMGGDGAILGAVRAFAEHPVPTIGINFGRVGFLASVPSGHWRAALEEVLDGRGVIEERMRLEARLVGSASTVRAVALNDMVVARGATQGMLSLGLYVDGDWVTDYRADGLILATASGSTAHSLSAGGPVLFPSMLAIVVTPICPQGLAHRPIVLPPDSRIEVAVEASSGLTTLAVDGQGFFPMRQGERVAIARHSQAYPLLTWSGLDPYRRLRERLGWSGVLSPQPREKKDGERHSDAGLGGVL